MTEEPQVEVQGVFVLGPGVPSNTANSFELGELAACMLSDACTPKMLLAASASGCKRSGSDFCGRNLPDPSNIVSPPCGSRFDRLLRIGTKKRTAPEVPSDLRSEVKSAGRSREDHFFVRL